MAKLQILGATRVAALQKMLDKQYTQKLTKLKAPELLSKHDAIQNFEDSHSIDLYGLVYNINAAASELKAAGVTSYSLHSALKISIDDVYDDDWRKDTPEWKAYYNKRKQLEQERDELKNRLWLCETLEEAKQIVGLN